MSQQSFISNHESTDVAQLFDLDIDIIYVTRDFL